MLNPKSVCIAIGIIAVLIGMATGCSPRQFFCDAGAPWCASTRI